MADVTQILARLEGGEHQAAAELLPLVYDELRKLAAAKLAHEKPGHTLQATALVHEAYLRLVGPMASGGREAPGASERRWDSRGHFFAAAAEAMRRILVENVRRKKAVKHGGSQQRVEIELADPSSRPSPLDLLALDEALERFAKLEPLKAELVKLRFFAGLTMPEAAEAQGISLATAERHWTYARTWLFAAMADGSETVSPSRKK
jgi:RNA polymerase sigma factor (TIGR02999 family)